MSGCSASDSACWPTDPGRDKVVSGLPPGDEQTDMAGCAQGAFVTIFHTSVYVQDQRSAHRFYSEKLGFVTKEDFPLGAGVLAHPGSAHRS